jgi:serine/threonine protein phosphatase PrpC
VVLIVGDMCYCANVGDSRAILSSDAGEVIVPLSRDHKPCEVNEYQRIV